MKDDEAVGSSGISAKILKASSYVKVRMITHLINLIVKEGTVLDIWLKNITVNVYKDKDNAL